MKTLQPTEAGWILDTHVHAYTTGGTPERLLRALLRHAHHLAPSAPAGMVILDRADGAALDLERFGQSLRDTGWTVAGLADHGGFSYSDVHTNDGRTPCARLYAGRQIVCAERIEVLALGANTQIADGIPLTETLRMVRDAGAVAVLPWGLGKWWGVRGAVVRSVIEAAEPGSLCLGDVPLRPRGWPLPAPMRSAHARGLHVLAGTDPFADADDADRVGSFATRIPLGPDGLPEPARLLEWLRNPRTPVTTTGRRGTFLTTLKRQWKARKLKHEKR